MSFDDDVRDDGRPNHRPTFMQFGEAVAERLRMGSAVYGDRSFERASVDLVDEELEDVAGWAFILWTRLRRVRDVLAFAEKETTRSERS